MSYSPGNREQVPMPVKKLFGYKCEFCSGTVKGKRVDREAFKHKTGFVILEQVTIGVCDQCGSRYYTADTLKRVRAITSGKAKPARTQRVPVAQAV